MKKSNLPLVLASLAIFVLGGDQVEAAPYDLTPPQHISISGKRGYSNGYNDFLTTRNFSPLQQNNPSTESYLHFYHNGYFNAAAEYYSGWDQGYCLGREFRRHEWNKRVRLFKEHSFRDPRGNAWDQGVIEGYNRGYEQATSTTSDSTENLYQEFLSKVSQNQDLQEILEKMQSVEQNNRCAEGVLAILSALMGEDIRQYGDWSDLTYTNGFPNITMNNLVSMLQKSDKFVQVNPNTPAKAFRINMIVYPTLNMAHIEIMGSDGKWYSDGVQVDGSQLNNYLPKQVISFDVDTSKYLGYTSSNSQSNSSYTVPFASFFDTDPNTATRNN